MDKKIFVVLIVVIIVIFSLSIWYLTLEPFTANKDTINQIKEYLGDGDMLIDKLKDFGLGVKTETVEVEQISIDQDWLLSI